MFFTTTFVNISGAIHSFGSIDIPWPQEINRRKQHNRKMVDSVDDICPHVMGGTSGREVEGKCGEGQRGGEVCVCGGSCGVGGVGISACERH